MKKYVKCCECNREQTLEFPDEFEGYPLFTYEQIRSYVKFREWVKEDSSFGQFVWDSDGKEVWLCPECDSKAAWLASQGSKQCFEEWNAD